MLMIRLQRVGRRNRAHFRVVVVEHKRAATSSNIVELLGSYDPYAGAISIQDERAKYWISQGAQVSDTVHNMLVARGVVAGEKIVPKKKEKVSASGDVAA